MFASSMTLVEGSTASSLMVMVTDGAPPMKVSTPCGLLSNTVKVSAPSTNESSLINSVIVALVWPAAITPQFQGTGEEHLYNAAIHASRNSVEILIFQQ